VKDAAPKTRAVPAAIHILEIIECLVTTGVPLTNTEISKQLHLQKSSVLSLLHTLRDRGYIDKDQESRYTLTLKLFGLAGSLIASLNLHQKAAPVLRDLARSSDLTGHLAVLHSGEAVYIDKADAPGAACLSTHVGYRVSVHASATGKALLAWLAESEVDRLTREFKQARALRAELAMVRRLGYAVREDKTGEPGSRTVAAPIFNGARSVVAAINLRGTLRQIPKKDIPILANRVVKAAQEISQSLGYTRRPA
jgi:DNA-binding IclR family transcriptional regulator